MRLFSRSESLFLCLLFWASAFRLLSCELLLILHVWQGLFPLCHINQGKKQQQKDFCANSRLCLMYSISRDATFSPRRGADLSEPNA